MPDEVEGAHLLGRRVVDLAGHVRERALVVRQTRLELGLVDVQDRRQLRRVHQRVLDHPGIGDHRRLRHRDREVVPLRSKMLPRSAGMVTVRTRCPSPSDERWERSRACRSKRRTPMAPNARTVTSTIPSTRAGWAGADGPARAWAVRCVRGARRRLTRDRAAVARRRARLRWRGAAHGARARHRAPVGARWRQCGGCRVGHGCWGARLDFAFDQSAMVSAVDPSSVTGSGAWST